MTHFARLRLKLRVARDERELLNSFKNFGGGIFSIGLDRSERETSSFERRVVKTARMDEVLSKWKPLIQRKIQ